MVIERLLSSLCRQSRAPPGATPHAAVDTKRQNPYCWGMEVELTLDQTAFVRHAIEADRLQRPEEAVRQALSSVRNPGHIRIAFCLLLFPPTLYSVYIRNERPPEPRRTLRCRAQSPFTPCSTHLQRTVLARFALRAHGKCGKPTCHCAGGEGHRSLYLVQSHAGKVRQICVPKALQDPVRQAVGVYQEAQRLIDEVSELEWKRFLARKG
jgi:hypothetical protein